MVRGNCAWNLEDSRISISHETEKRKIQYLYAYINKDPIDIPPIVVTLPKKMTDRTKKTKKSCSGLRDHFLKNNLVEIDSAVSRLQFLQLLQGGVGKIKKQLKFMLKKTLPVTRTSFSSHSSGRIIVR